MTLVCTWHISQDEPTVLVTEGKRPKPRRWRVRIWAADGDVRHEEIIVSGRVLLSDLLPTALDQVQDMLDDLQGRYWDAGFEICRLDGKGRQG